MSSKQQIGTFYKNPKIIALQPIESFKISDFIALGSMFQYVNPVILEIFPWETKNSRALELANYELIGEDNDEDIAKNAVEHSIYCEVTLAHIYHICKRHIKNAENLLNEDSINLFLVRDKSDNLNSISIYREDNGNKKIWNMSVNNFSWKNEHESGSTFFFLGEPIKYIAR